jgi:hypothetical protein
VPLKEDLVSSSLSFFLFCSPVVNFVCKTIERIEYQSVLVGGETALYVDIKKFQVVVSGWKRHTS